MDEYGWFIRTIQKTLHEKRYTARQLALEVKIHPSYITRMLAGKRNPPSDEIIRKIAAVLHLDADQLLLSVGRAPGFLRVKNPLTEKEFQDLKRFSEKMRQYHQQKKAQGSP